MQNAKCKIRPFGRPYGQNGFTLIERLACQPKLQRRQALHGFTLIELLVVIAIISLLVSILLPSLKKAKTLARRTMCATNLRSLAMGMAIYASENDGYIVPATHGSTAVPNYVNTWSTNQPDYWPYDTPQMTMLSEACGEYNASVDLKRPNPDGYSQDQCRESFLDRYGQAFQCPEGETLPYGFGGTNWSQCHADKSGSWISYGYLASGPRYIIGAGTLGGIWGRWGVELPEKLGQFNNRVATVTDTRPVTQVLFTDTAKWTSSSWVGPPGQWFGTHVEDPDVPQTNSAYHDGHVEWHSGSDAETYYNYAGSEIAY